MKASCIHVDSYPKETINYKEVLDETSNKKSFQTAGIPTNAIQSKTTTETLVDHQLEIIPRWNILCQENKFLKSILSQKLQKNYVTMSSSLTHSKLSVREK